MTASAFEIESEFRAEIFKPCGDVLFQTLSKINVQYCQKFSFIRASFRGCDSLPCQLQDASRISRRNPHRTVNWVYRMHAGGVSHAEIGFHPKCKVSDPFGVWLASCHIHCSPLCIIEGLACQSLVCYQAKDQYQLGQISDSRADINVSPHGDDPLTRCGNYLYSGFSFWCSSWLMGRLSSRYCK